MHLKSIFLSLHEKKPLKAIAPFSSDPGKGKAHDKVQGFVGFFLYVRMPPHSAITISFKKVKPGNISY